MKVSAVLFGLMGFAVGILSDSYQTAFGVIILLCFAISILWVTGEYHAERSRKDVLLQYASKMEKLLDEARESNPEQRVQLFKEMSAQAEAMKLFLQNRGG